MDPATVGSVLITDVTLQGPGLGEAFSIAVSTVTDPVNFLLIVLGVLLGMLMGILGGDAQVMSGSYFSILPYVESGDVRMVMTCNTNDSPPEFTPDSATLASAGVDNAQAIVDMLATRRIYAGPPEIDDDVAQINADAYMSALQSDSLQSEAEEADRPIVPLAGPDAQEAVSGFIDNWSEREELLATLYGQ